MWTQKNGPKRSTSIGSVCGNGMDVAENQWRSWVIKPRRTSIENLKQSKTCHCLQQLICVSTCFHFSLAHSHARTIFFCSYPIFWICLISCRCPSWGQMGFGSTPSRLGWYDQQDLVAWWLWRPCQCCQLPNWSPVINEDSRYGYLMIFEYWQISYMIICCTKAPVSAKTCEAWFIMCIYIYIYCAYMFVYLRIIFFYGRMKKEQNQKLVVSHRGPHRSLKLCILKRCGTTTVPWWSQKQFFYHQKTTWTILYIYSGFGFWCILMYFDGLTDFRFLTAWNSPCALDFSSSGDPKTLSTESQMPWDPRGPK